MKTLLLWSIVVLMAGVGSAQTSPLQLLNAAAPPQHGSGWDNVEWFPASGSGPMLKLFSISF
jgi:hypothetical protein